MKRILCISILALITASISMAGDEQALSPLVKNDDSGCSVDTLNGDYSFTLSGTRAAPAPPSGIPNYVPGTIEQVIGAGVLHFDGKGGVDQTTTDKGSLSGILFPTGRSGSGTYTINADCTGATTVNLAGLPFSIVSDFVVADRGREYHAFVASPQSAMVSFSGRRQK